MDKWQSPKDDNLIFDFTLASNSQNIDKAVEHLIALLECDERHKSRHSLYLGLILENLVLAHKRGEQFRVSYHRGKSFYSKNGFRHNKSRNPRGISYLLMRYIETMERHEMLVSTIGFRDWEGGGKSFLARMKPTDRFFREIVVPFGLHKVAFNSRLFRPPVVIKDGNWKHYETQAYKDMAKKVTAYNEFYNNFEIGILDRRYDCLIFPDGKHLHRVFNQNNLEKGGRFYGGWWQQKSEEDRALILIEGRKTVELDYSGAHIGLLYGLSGTLMPAQLAADPYALPDLSRTLVKLCVLRSLNNSSAGTAWRSVNRELFLQGNEQISKGDYEEIMEKFNALHTPIMGQFFKEDLSLTLQYLDSLIADHVLEDLMLKQGIPVLPIHDSFIVMEGYEQELHKAMVRAYQDSDDPRLRLSFTSIKDKNRQIIQLE